jgi:hypothetical protein
VLAPYPICFSDRGTDVFVDLFDLDAGEESVVMKDRPSLIAGER